MDEIDDLIAKLKGAKNTTLSEDEDYAVRTIIGEAKGEGEKGWEAVADVIRTRSKQSGKRIKDVVLAPSQFEPWQSRRKELESYDPDSPTYRRVAQTVLPVLRGERKGPVGDMTHFYSPTVQAAMGRKPPEWAKGPGFAFGNHRFYNLGYGGKGKHGIPDDTDSIIQQLRNAESPITVDDDVDGLIAQLRGSVDDKGGTPTPEQPLRPLNPDGSKPLIAPGQPLAPNPNDVSTAPIQAAPIPDDIDRSIYKGNLRFLPDTSELEKIGEAAKEGKEYEDNYEVQTRFNLEQIKNPNLTVEEFNKKLQAEYDAERAIKERDFLEKNKDYAEWLKAAEKKDSNESRQEFNEVMKAARPIAQQQVAEFAGSAPAQSIRGGRNTSRPAPKDTGRGTRAIPVPISELPAENIDQYLTQKVGQQLAFETGYQPEIVDEFIKANKGNLLTGVPYTKEEIEGYREKGVETINVHVTPGLVANLQNFTEQRKTEQRAIDELRKRTAEGKGSLLTPDWEATIGKYAKWLMQSPFGPVRAGVEAVTDEDRQKVIDEGLTEKIKTAGSAQEALRLAKEYEAMGGAEKTFRHIGDVASAVGRAPATFARTLAWAEDTVDYLQDKAGVKATLTTTDILNGAGWLYSKIAGQEVAPAESGTLPNIYAKFIDEAFKQDPYTRDTVAGKIATGTGSAIPFLLGAAATGGSNVAVMLLGAGMSVGDQYKQAKDEGLSREKQILSGLTGIPLGMTEALGLKWAKAGEVLQNLSKGKFIKSFAKWATETGSEATEEALQEYFQSAAGKVVLEGLKNDGVTKDTFAKAMGSSLQDALTGGIVGLLFGGGAPLASHVIAKKNEAKILEPSPSLDEEAVVSAEKAEKVKPEVSDEWRAKVADAQAKLKEIPPASVESSDDVSGDTKAESKRKLLGTSEDAYNVPFYSDKDKADYERLSAQEKADDYGMGVDDGYNFYADKEDMPADQQSRWKESAYYDDEGTLIGNRLDALREWAGDAEQKPQPPATDADTQETKAPSPEKGAKVTLKSDKDTLEVKSNLTSPIRSRTRELGLIRPKESKEIAPSKLESSASSDVSGEAKVEPKEPWQMTPEEWSALSSEDQDALHTDTGGANPSHSNYHQVRVQSALHQGQDVPRNVLDTAKWGTARSYHAKRLLEDYYGGKKYPSASVEWAKDALKDEVEFGVPVIDKIRQAAEAKPDPQTTESKARGQSPARPTDNKYYYQPPHESEWREIPKAKAVTIPNFEDGDFAIHRPLLSGGKGWVVSEGRTGQNVGTGRTQAEAILDAQTRLERNKDRFESAVQTRLEKTGPSPRYTTTARDTRKTQETKDEISPAPTKPSRSPALEARKQRAADRKAERMAAKPDLSTIQKNDKVIHRGKEYEVMFPPNAKGYTMLRDPSTKAGGRLVKSESITPISQPKPAVKAKQEATIESAKAIAVPRSAAKRYSYADEVADQIASPEFKEAEARSAKENPSSTGFTKTQTAYVTKALEQYIKDFPHEDTPQGYKYESTASVTETIAVPDDGVIRIKTPDQANNLHTRLTGEPLKGWPKQPGQKKFSANATLPSSYLRSQMRPKSLGGPLSAKDRTTLDADQKRLEKERKVGHTAQDVNYADALRTTPNAVRQQRLVEIEQELREKYVSLEAEAPTVEKDATTQEPLRAVPEDVKPKLLDFYQQAFTLPSIEGKNAEQRTILKHLKQKGNALQALVKCIHK